MSRLALCALIPALLAPALALSGAPAGRAAPPAPIQSDGLPDLDDETSRTIFFAVLEGLYADGADNDTVDVILRLDPRNGYPELFVYACPICMPAYDAFRVYRQRAEFFNRKSRTDTFGAGLPADVRAQFTAPDRDTRWKALNVLVEGYVQERLAGMRLTEAEQREWRQRMEEGRKKGMSYLIQYQGEQPGVLYPGMKACALCDAANEACEKL
ncbi:MAG: hypothetical protein EYC70_02945 [Planctomycetota bacterium]|nr:MAG: hypothetical protein EYC70_02945 [Planctomycetota bacterium]